jgi:hypothetical protein
MFAAPLAAFAKPATDALTGRWSWKGSAFNGCTVNGTMTIGPPTAKRACAIDAVQTCGKEIYRAKQACAVSLKGNQVAITSKIVSAPETYRPDNFTLTLESATSMRGTLSSPPYDPLSAVFWRGPDVIS